ncbi:MAG: competence/damage-inducible protein A [Bacteroidetes bacterium]|nr:MAG: competence/damage-inducible protein A [Bacteroidota bacterium]
MTSEIITIGDELLIGQVINTNASWMAKSLNENGAVVRQITSVSDSADEIVRALREAEERADVLLITGGLGPTHDDITKDILCKYFQTELVEDEKVLENIHRFFQRKGLPLTELNRKQALVPKGSTVIENPLGTAPGLAFHKNGKLFVAMPGVPYEMKHIMENFVIPWLQDNYPGNIILHKTVMTQGIGESFLAAIIADWVDELPSEIKLAYLPSPGIVRLRLSIKGNDRNAMTSLLSGEIQKLRQLIPEYFWGFDDEKLEAVVGEILKKLGRSVCTAESCTGGYIAHRITGVPGSSNYFKGSVVAYDNKVKEKLLKVPSYMLERFGAVSREVVEKMAEEACNLMQTDYAVSVSGIAGPDGGTEEKPVGTVWIAVAGPEAVVSKKFLFGDERERNIVRAGTAALGLLRSVLIQKEGADPKAGPGSRD